MARVIQNFEELAGNNALRLDALAIAEAGYAAVNTHAAFTQKLRLNGDELHIEDRTYNLAGRHVFFVGVGKCAVAAAQEIETILGDRLTGGIALDVAAPATAHALSKIEAHIGTHPLPSEKNERATERIIELLSHGEENDFVLMLISGGGSTLLCLHEAPMTCLDESMLFTELTARGAKIQDINTVRKHTSRAHGGGLAKAAYPAEVVSLIISDVPGNDPEYIASGPTMLDTSTVDDAQAILARYRLTPPAQVVFMETPKEEKYFERVTNILFLTNQDALRAMQREAEERSYKTTVVDDRLTGKADDAGRSIVATLHETPAKTVLLYAGETTVVLGGTPGRGGRNQEMALAALADIRDGELMLPFASDGRDNTDHAGGIADAATRAHADARHLSIEDYLARHSSYDFFATTGDALQTGYTGSNVSDLIIAIKN